MKDGGSEERKRQLKQQKKRYVTGKKLEKDTEKEGSKRKEGRERERSVK